MPLSVRRQLAQPVEPDRDSGDLTRLKGMTEFQEGFDIMRSGQSGKVILDWKD